MANPLCEPTMFLRHAESLLTSARRDRLLLEYPLIRDQAHFAEPHWAEQLRASAKHLSGIYIWTVRPGDSDADRHVAYVGRTRSLARRLAEYLAEFQPHSVNDHKLRVFQEHILDKFPQARFALHFKSVPDPDLAVEESVAIRLFEPLLNQKLSPPSAAREAFREAFMNYYLAGLNPFLPAVPKP